MIYKVHPIRRSVTNEQQRNGNPILGRITFGLALLAASDQLKLSRNDAPPTILVSVKEFQ